MLFTKKFPFGHQETYLFNELPFLEKAFNRIIIVPYDEFVYNESECRINSSEKIEIYPINRKIKKLNIFQMLKREIYVWNVLFFELLKGREPIHHLKYIKRISSQLRHTFASAVELKEYVGKEEAVNFVLYNYWLHGGVLIGNFINKLLKLNNNNVISRAHAYDVYHKDWYTIYPDSPYLFLPFESWKVYHTNKIATISMHGYNHFLSLYPKLDHKFSVARLGVLDSYTKVEKGNEDVLVWMTCSNIDENKRVYRIPELISKMNYSVKWFHFGKENSDSDLKKLEKEISKYNLSNSCKLMGFMQNTDIIEFYRNNYIDLFLNLSQIEGIPVSLMEAASFGIPMVATNTVGNPEIVNSENGFLIDVNFNPDDLAKELNTFFNDPQVIFQKRNAARKTFLQNYNASQNYPEFIEKILLN